MLNAEGEAKTPALGYFGEGEALMGKLVGYRISAHSLRNPSSALLLALCENSTYRGRVWLLRWRSGGFSLGSPRVT